MTREQKLENIVKGLSNPDLFRIDVTTAGKLYQMQIRDRLLQQARAALGNYAPEMLFRGRTSLLTPNGGMRRKEDETA